MSGAQFSICLIYSTDLLYCYLIMLITFKINHGYALGELLQHSMMPLHTELKMHE